MFERRKDGDWFKNKNLISPSGVRRNGIMPGSEAANLLQYPYLRLMKWYILVCIISTVFLSVQLTAQPTPAEQRIDAYLKSIRHDVPALRQFFYRMPKGGDLHHHFHGSVYGETMVEQAVKHDFWLHRATLDVQAPGFRPARKARGQWAKFSTLQAEGLLDAYRAKLLQRWSNLYYEPGKAERSSHDHFFSTFPAFDPVMDSCFAIGLAELKRRAIAERVSYIETMFIPVQHSIAPGLRWDELLRRNAGDSAALFPLLSTLFDEIKSELAYRQSVETHNALVRRLHETEEIDDARFTMRYQNYVLRVKPPRLVFADLVMSFASAQAEPLIVGINIVAPEDHATAMQDYALHMRFFQFLRQQFPGVKCALHAGELTLGLVKPEDLSWHIDAAVRIAGANRIGHGVGIPYESPALLEYLAENDIPVEINLSSNAFILGIQPQDHPISLYRRAGVPLVISTDDAGVLRHNLSEEYVLLYQHQPFSYAEIKQLAFNAIRYSFLPVPAVRERLLDQLRMDFLNFERAW